jgi:hypothetical protein
MVVTAMLVAVGVAVSSTTAGAAASGTSPDEGDDWQQVAIGGGGYVLQVGFSVTLFTSLTSIKIRSSPLSPPDSPPLIHGTRAVDHSPLPPVHSSFTETLCTRNRARTLHSSTIGLA